MQYSLMPMTFDHLPGLVEFAEHIYANTDPDKYPDFKNKDFRIAQNQELVADTALLTGQEIAVLPPFAGG